MEVIDMRTRLGVGLYVGWALAAWISGCGSDNTLVQSPKPAARTTMSPYAGTSSAAVPSLTEQEVDDLLAGRGLGMARAAELNGYPGPRHVLDLRSELGLDEDAIQGAQKLFEEMQAAAQPLGAQVVALEKALGETFASQSADEDAVSQQVDALAELMAQLRALHLRAHIRMKALLSPQQVARYQELRGYSVSPSSVDAAGAGADAHSAHHHAM
jgi:Spy/CpxP family protein refolding chaperone